MRTLDLCLRVLEAGHEGLPADGVTSLPLYSMRNPFSAVIQVRQALSSGMVSRITALDDGELELKEMDEEDREDLSFFHFPRQLSVF